VGSLQRKYWRKTTGTVNGRKKRGGNGRVGKKKEEEKALTELKSRLKIGSYKGKGTTQRAGGRGVELDGERH